MQKTSQAQKRLFQTDHLEELLFESLWAYSWRVGINVSIFKGDPVVYTVN